MKKLKLVSVILLGGLLLAGCNNVKDGVIVLNDSSPSATFDDTLVSFERYSSSGYYDSFKRDIFFYFSVENKSNQEATYNIENPVLTNCLNETDYKVNVDSEFSLLPGGKQQLTFYTQILYNIPENNLGVSFKLNGQGIGFSYYVKVSRSGPNCNVKYILDGREVNCSLVGPDSFVNDAYIYESDDHLYFCNEWFFDIERTQQFLRLRDKIKEDTTLYGTAKSNLEFSPNIDEYNSLYKINHFPSDGIVIIKAPNDKEIHIGLLAFNWAGPLKEIYIPKSVTYFDFNNFYSINSCGAVIYYEGTEEEWNAIDKRATTLETVEPENLVFNTTYGG